MVTKLQMANREETHTMIISITMKSKIIAIIKLILLIMVITMYILVIIPPAVAAEAEAAALVETGATGGDGSSPVVVTVIRVRLPVADGITRVITITKQAPLLASDKAVGMEVICLQVWIVDGVIHLDVVDGKDLEVGVNFRHEIESW
mmetsp:Transcript_24650/g.36506  ORF Transcript_24650/g.36506 Transcript_24650/m.36506 type:complete len:148 (-) Transcript_24650:99-542(-)